MKSRSHDSALDSQTRLQGALSFQPLQPLTIRNLVAWAFKRLERKKIRGNSMHPTLRAGQEVLIKRLEEPSPDTIKAGMILYIQHPLNTEIQMVKRCSHWEGTKLWVLGDNAIESTDSRQFGAISARFVLGCIVCTFP